jgi:S1-C subfamily serine protease
VSTMYGPYPQYPQDGSDPEEGGGRYRQDCPHPPYGSPAGYGAVPPPPPPPMWPGHGGSHGHGRPAKGRRAMMMVAGAAAVALAAGGTALATSSGSSTLSTASIASKTGPGLVDITSTLGYQRATAEGTGMVLTPTGEVLTNNHVVAGATSVSVRDIGNGRTYSAKVVGYSDSDDVAVLQLTGASGLSTVSIGNSGTVTSGQKIVALGNAEGKGGTPAVATGSVVATGANITAEDQGDGVQEHLTDMIQTNADIEPGDSGGPLLNSAGQVVGMDTAASTSNSTEPGTDAAQTTAAFSIPIDRALSLADQIEAGTSSSTVHIGVTAFLGVEVASSSTGAEGFGGFGQSGQGSTGVTIEGVVQGTAAAGAGLTEGDTIVSVGGHQITSASDLQTVMEQHHPGDKVSVDWTNQSGQAQTATVTLTTGPTG